MVVGFLLSRAVLSIGVILFGINALWDVNPKHWFRNRWWLWGVAWIACYALSGLWSDNMSSWSYGLTVKLPILLLPLSFSFVPKFTAKQLSMLTMGIAIMLYGSVAYSMYYLLSDIDYYIEQYRIAKVMPMLGHEDHIRYSLFNSLFVVWCIFILSKVDSKLMKRFTVFTVVFFMLYIHVLAVKTGIVILYLFILGWGLYLALSRRNFLGIGLIILMAVIAYKAYDYIPTYAKKVDYFVYSMRVLNEGRFDSNYSDIGRLISYDIAINKLREAPITGYGLGDVEQIMAEGYRTMYPNVPDWQKLKPHNQLLMVAMACGIVLTLIFIIWAFYPLKWVKKSRDGFFMFVIWFVMWVPLMVEPTLEIQLGIFVYLIFMLLLAHNIRGGITVVESKS